MKAIHYFFLLLFTPLPFTPELQFNFVIWNVGQGSWSILILETDCVHFDMGGEKLPIKESVQICKNKKNWILLSHEDWDHIAGIQKFRQRVSNVCLHYPTSHHRRWLSHIESCPEKLPSPVKVVFWGMKSSNKNAGSIVYQIGNEVLIPGDSPRAAEKLWRKKNSSANQGAFTRSPW